MAKGVGSETGNLGKSEPLLHGPILSRIIMIPDDIAKPGREPPCLGHYSPDLAVGHAKLLPFQCGGFGSSCDGLGQELCVAAFCCGHEQSESSHIVHQACRI